MQQHFVIVYVLYLSCISIRSILIRSVQLIFLGSRLGEVTLINLFNKFFTKISVCHKYAV